MAALVDLENLLQHGTAGPWVEGNGYAAIISRAEAALAAERARPMSHESDIRAYGGALVGESIKADDRALIVALRNHAEVLLEVAGLAQKLADEAARACTEPRRFHANEDHRQQALSVQVAAMRLALTKLEEED